MLKMYYSMQVEGRELQVLYPLLEFLHHHRLNAANPHALSDAFALLLMRPQCDTGFRDAEHIAEAYCVLTDLLIQRYRTLFQGDTSLLQPNESKKSSLLADVYCYFVKHE